MSYPDYNMRPTGGNPFTDEQEYTLYQCGLPVGKTTWGWLKDFRDYYGIIDAGEVVETWKQENLISHRR